MARALELFGLNRGNAHPYGPSRRDSVIQPAQGAARGLCRYAPSPGSVAALLAAAHATSFKLNIDDAVPFALTHPSAGTPERSLRASRAAQPDRLIPQGSPNRNSLVPAPGCPDARTLLVANFRNSGSRQRSALLAARR